MDLTTLPARLTEAQAESWSNWIFKICGSDNLTALKIELEETYEDVKSVRSELSKLLNGHTRIVDRWFGDNPSDKGKALCDLIGETPESMVMRYTALIPPPRATGITAEHLKTLSLRIRIKGKEEPVTWDCGKLREFLSTELESFENDESPLQVQLNRTADHPLWRSGQPSCAMALITRWLRDFTDARAGVDLGVDGESSYWCHPRPDVELTPAPITQEDIHDWISNLKSTALITNESAERVQSFVKLVPDLTLDTLSPAHLVRVVEDIRENRLTNPDACSIHARRIEWERKALHDRSTPYAQKWLGRTRHCFTRWLDIAGALHGDINRGELHRVLDIQSGEPTDESTVMPLLEDLALIDSDQDFEKYRAKILTHLPNPLIPELLGSELIERVESDRFRLTEEARSFAELEVSRWLEPDVLESLDASANQHLIAEAVRLATAESLSEWYSIGVRIKGIDQPTVMLAIARGLARRSDLDELDASSDLTTLWASALWASLHGLHRTTEGPYSGFEFTFAVQLSPGLRHTLPRLDGDQSLYDRLRQFVSPSILETVEAWCPSLELSPDDINDFIFRHAPFQVPMGRMDISDIKVIELNWGYYWKVHPVLHHAEQGDREARLTLLGTRGPSFPELREKIPLITILEWHLDAINRNTDDERVFQRAQQDINIALGRFFEERDPDLIPPLRILLGDNNLRPRAPLWISSPITAVMSGPVAMISWLLNEYALGGEARMQPPVPEPLESDKAKHIDAEEYLLTMAELLNAKEPLRDLIAIDPEDLDSQLNYDLFSASPGKKPEQGHRFKAPKLHFPHLRRFARIRHRALLLLAKLGDPTLLRESLERPWEVKSSCIANPESCYRTLNKTLRDVRSEAPPELPNPADPPWEELLEALSPTSLEEPYSNFTAGWPRWNEYPNQYAFPSYLLAIRSAPRSKRWALLKPCLTWLWNNRWDENILHSDIFQQILEASTPKDSDYVWHEPSEFREEREQWALKHDGQYLRTWCENHSNINKLAKDLEWADSMWHHLTEPQQYTLLKDIADLPTNDEPQADRWWKRARRMLSTADLLRFAHRHGSPIDDRRDIARRWVNEADESDRLDTYLKIKPDERPDPDIIDMEIDQLLEDTKSTDFDEDHIIYLDKLLRTPSPSLRQRLLPIYVEEKAKLLIDRCSDLDAIRGNLEEPISVDWLQKVTEDLDDKDLRTSRHKIENMITSLTRFAKQLYPSEYERHLYLGIVDELERWKEKALDALSPTPEIESSTHSPPPTEPDEILESLSPDEAGFHDKYQSALENKSDDQRNDLLRELVKHRKFASKFDFFGEVIEQIDRSTMSSTEAIEVAEQWLDTYRDVRDDERERMTHLVGLHLHLRRSELRRLIRERAKALLA